MAEIDSTNYRELERLFTGSGGTLAFGGDEAAQCSRALAGIVADMGYNPGVTAEFRAGVFRLFNVELINAPDFTANRYILAPNHVSDFDAIVLGLLHPRIRIVAKQEWTQNEKLKGFLGAHYDLFGLDRSSMRSLRDLLADAFGYFQDGENNHYLVFSQGTISDFNNNSPERVSAIAQKVSDKTGVPVICMFIEQVSLRSPTRIVFDEPVVPAKRDDFRIFWLERERAMQQSLSPPARPPVLTYKHSNNNKPGDPFF